MKLSNLSLINVLLIFSLAVPFQAFSAVLEEITVTAQKREQNLSDVGISVTAFSGDQLKALGVTNTEQLDDQVPGLMVTDYGGGVTTIFTIRGSAQMDFADLQEPPVAVYSDGAYNSYLAGVGMSFFDLDRIEVLRGPQGTLFGRNATGGVVHLVSARPTRENEGYLEATGGEYGQHQFEGAISGPLSDSLAGRLSMAYTATDGYTENLVVPGERGGEAGNFSGRAQLLYEPNDDLSVLLLGHWGTDDTNGQHYITKPVAPNAEGLSAFNPSTADFNAFCDALGFGPAAATSVGPGGAADCFGTPDDGDNRTSLSDNVGNYQRDHFGFTNEVNWTTGDIKITNIFNYQDFKKRYNEDTEAAPFPAFDFFQDMDSTQISEEFRLAWERDNLQITVGAFYLKIDSDMHTGVDNLFFGFNLDNTITLETETWAAFIQAEWAINEQFTVIGGVRWTEDDKKMSFLPSCPGLGIPGNPCAPVFGPGAAQSNDLNLERSEGDWSGVLELDYMPNDDWLIYAKYSRGHKAGGFNGGPASTYLTTDVEFDGEILIAYEAGFKASFFGGKARVNTSVFYYDYNNFQTFNAAGIDLFLSNIDAENTGAEIEIVTNPWDGWEFLFGVGLQDGKQKDFNFGGITRDRPLPNSPDLMLNGLARYEFTGFMDGTMAAQVDFNYVDSRTLNAVDHPSMMDGSYTVVNARLGWTSADAKWEASVWVKNLGDVEYVPTAFEFGGFTGTAIQSYNPPRWFGGTVRYNWGG